MTQTTQSATRSKALMIDWHRRVRENQYVHYETAAHFSRLSYRLGIPAVILSAIVGTAIFASLAKDANQVAGGDSRPIWTILVGLISVVAAALTSLQTFLRYPERAANHRRSGAAFGAIRRELEHLLVFVPDSESELNLKLEKIRRKMDQLALESPEVPSALKARFDRLVPKDSLKFLREPTDPDKP